MSSAKECLDLIVSARGLDDVVVLDGHNEAIIGFDTEAECVIYDYHKIIENLVKDGCSDEDAREYYEYNVARALPYMGERRPIIAIIFDGSDWDTTEKATGL